MTRKKKKVKKIANRMRVQLGIVMLICAGILALSFSVFLWRTLKVSDKSESTMDKQAVDLIEKIDALRIVGNDQLQLEELRESYVHLSEKLQQQVTKARYEKLLEAIELGELVRETGNQVIVKDKSRNGYDLDLEKASEAELKNYEGKIAFEGKAKVQGADDTFNALISGTNSFTIEAVINANNWGYTDEDFNMIVSKGDSSAAFRVSDQSLHFFIKGTDGDWKAVTKSLTEEQMNSWIHVAAIYNGNDISVYLEGNRLQTKEDVGAISFSEYPFGIGYCVETGRIGTASIQSLRVYSQALTKAELDEGIYSPEDDNVVLWYDFEDYICPNLNIEAKGLRTFRDAVEIKEEGGTANIQAEMIPYYAPGELRYYSNKEEIAAVAEDGTVLGKKKGNAVITVKAEGTDFQLEIPVTVGASNFKLYRILEWAENKLVLIEVRIFVVVLVMFLFWQRRQLLVYLSELSDAVSLIGTKESEIELSPMLGDVQERIRKVETDLVKKDLAAKEAEQKKNDLVVYLAHDLKTPIASIIGYLTLLQDQNQIAPEVYQQYVEMIMKNTERLNELVDEFFEITRFNLSKFTLNCCDIQLYWLLRQMLFDFQPMFQEKGLTCVLDAPEDLYLWCDGDKMERVFDNLLRNAINYSFPGTEIHISVFLGEEAELIFKNRGNTIPKEKLEHIFEQFYRVDYARSSSTGGAGLGLAIAKQIVELHGGQIIAESQDDTICFTVKIPVKKKDK